MQDNSYKKGINNADKLWEYGKIPTAKSQEQNSQKQHTVSLNILAPKASSKLKRYQMPILLALASATVMGTGIPAEAFSLNFDFAEGTTQEQMLGFEMAGEIYEELLDSDVTVNIKVRLEDFGKSDSSNKGVIGLADPVRGIYQTDDYQMIIDGATGKEIVTSNEVMLTSANAKARGLDVASSLDPNNPYDGYDGTITLNSNIINQGKEYNWNYDVARQSDLGETEFDFLSVALHEIGHVIGFVSGIDGDTAELASNKGSSGNQEDKPTAAALDMFRYSEESANQGIIDISVDEEKRFFSIDGGQTEITEFSTGLKEIGGDGYQASHWKDKNNGNSLGIMDPAIAPKERGRISDNDLQAFEAIGWKLTGKTWQDLDPLLLKDRAEDRVNALLEEQQEQEQQELEALLGGVNTSQGYQAWWWNFSSIWWWRRWWWQQGFFASGDWDDPAALAALEGDLAYFDTADFSSGYFDTADFSSALVSVPEPGSTIGLLGLGLFGVVSTVKRRSKK